jgi:hypothetical protein
MSTDHATSQDSSSHRRRIRAYLQNTLADRDGDLYVKSREIAAATDLTAKQVGVFLSQLQEDASEVSIEQWGYSNATTWRVTSP